jgi:hypothetical protein
MPSRTFELPPYAEILRRQQGGASSAPAVKTQEVFVNPTPPPVKNESKIPTRTSLQDDLRKNML